MNDLPNKQENKRASKAAQKFFKKRGMSTFRDFVIAKRVMCPTVPREKKCA